MEKAILTVHGRTETEKIIEKSRFLTYSTHVESEEEARAFIAEIRAMHPFATHCCFAFVADKLGNLQRFSDDGEPQGTAGMPILDVLKEFDVKRVYYGHLHNWGTKPLYEEWEGISFTLISSDYRAFTPVRID